MKLGALEAGGTKMVCAIGDENGTIMERASFPTAKPEDTIPPLMDYFKSRGVDALGIGTFGPVGVIKGKAEYGKILDTPKAGWKYFNLLGAFKNGLNIPVGFDTDVNSSLIGEMSYGCARGLSDVIYLTVGTGIGAGIAVNGTVLYGTLHSEAGHLNIRRHPTDDFKGSCPYHGDCLEGMASGPAIQARYGVAASELVDNQAVWEMEGYYLAEAISMYILTLAPQLIILGGGVMHQRQLFPIIRKDVVNRLNGYINTREFKDIDHYIVPESLDGNQGILGCLQIAKNAYVER